MWEEERRGMRLVASEMAVLRLWRMKERMEGLMLMEMESFRELKQESGYGVEWQRDLMVEGMVVLVVVVVRVVVRVKESNERKARGRRS